MEFNDKEKNDFKHDEPECEFKINNFPKYMKVEIGEIQHHHQ
jgi:hypothetical protein